MAHQTGIQADEDLKSAIKNALRGDLRVLKVAIRNEQLVKDVTLEPQRGWEEDFELVQPLLQDNSACYILYRLDEKDNHGNYKWIFFSFTPNDAPVRDKMLYSATKATLKKEFSGGAFKDDINATEKNEVSFKGYQKHITAAEAPPPLTIKEKELMEVNEAEKQVMSGTTSRHSHMKGMSFPLMEKAVNALVELSKGKLTYVQLAIDKETETIILSKTESSIGAADLGGQIPDDEARYHFFLYKHHHEGDYLESIVFIYSCAGYKVSVKDRMLYSTCKNTTIDQAGDNGVEVVKKIEVDDTDIINEDFLYSEVHPKKTIVRPKFPKPKPPGRAASNGRR